WRRVCGFRFGHRDAPRCRLSRLACRRGRTGSGGGAGVSLRGYGVPPVVGARRREIGCASAGGGEGGDMSQPLLVKAARTGRTIARVTPKSAGWRYVGFEATWLAPGESYEAKTGDRELCIVVISGRVS